MEWTGVVEIEATQTFGSVMRVNVGGYAPYGSAEMTGWLERVRSGTMPGPSDLIALGRTPYEGRVNASEKSV
jgi:hypothetical protein